MSVVDVTQWLVILMLATSGVMQAVLLRRLRTRADGRQALDAKLEEALAELRRLMAEHDEINRARRYRKDDA